MRTLKYKDQNIEYELVRKSVKNINVRIRSDGQVFVSASPHVPIKVIEDFLLTKADIILHNIEKFLQTKPEKHLESGDKVLVLNNNYELTIVKGKVNTIELIDNKLFMTITNDDIAVKQKLLDSAIKKLMREPLLELCDKVYLIFKPLGVEYPNEIRIKNMKSRWGSCNAAKKILAFSTMLCSMPMPFVEYVVVHEFAHFIYPNHSKDFYKLIETIMPDYKARRALGARAR